MDACDVIFTKPGGLTSTEALVKRIPIVHTAPIPGCETANRNFFVKRHLSVSSKYIAKQITLGKDCSLTPRIRMGTVLFARKCFWPRKKTGNLTLPCTL